MKNLLIAAAVMTAAGAADAQSSMTIFGILDVALLHATATGGGHLNLLTPSEFNASRLGFRGSEDLGGGMSASFVLDGVIFPDDGRAGGSIPAGNQPPAPAGGGGMNFNRRSTVSLAGNWGEVRLGRDFTPTFFEQSTYDPFGVLGIGTSQVQVGAAAIAPAGTLGVMVRASNQIAYFLPKDLGGTYGQAAYWLGENAQNGAATQRDGTGYAGRLGYAKGPFDVSAAWGKTKFAAGDYTTWGVGGQWNFGVINVMSMVQNDRRSAPMNVEGRGWVLGAVLPLGQSQIMVAYSAYALKYGVAGRPDPKQRKWALGYVYNLSKRTALYAQAARVQNSSGFVGGPASTVIGSVAYGPGVINGSSTGNEVGIRHSF